MASRKPHYQRMPPAEFKAKMEAAGIGPSDAIKLLGRPFFAIDDYRTRQDQHKPTASEMVLLDLLSEYPELTPVALDMVEVRIIDDRPNKVRLITEKLEVEIE